MPPKAHFARAAVVALALLGAAPPATAAPELSPPSLDFGAVAVGQHADRTLTIANPAASGVTLKVTAVAATGAGFSLFGLSAALPATIAEGASLEATFRFESAGAGARPGSIDIAWTETSTTGGGDPVTRTYKQGFDGYAGGKSVNISTLSAEASNGFNGTTFGDSVDWCIGDLPAQNYDISPLMRYEDLGIPSGAVVTEASLTCTFIFWEGTGNQVLGHYLQVPWTTEFGAGGAGVGWLRRDTGVSWAAPGARGEGSDVVAGKSFAFGAMNANGAQVRTAALDAAVVQGWVDDPASNYGVVLTVDAPDHHTGFRQMQNDAAADRPVLSITYTTAGGMPTDGSASVAMTGLGAASGSGLAGFVTH